MRNRYMTGKDRCSAFTLLEVMVAMSIIAIALAAVLGSQSQSVSLATETKFNTTAVLLAQMKIAEMDLDEPKNLISDSGTFGEDFPDYYWETAINSVTLPEAESISKHLVQIDLKIFRGKDSLYRCGFRFYRFSPI